MNKRKIIIFLFLILAPIPAFAATFNDAATGNWNIGTTWGGACTSSCSEGTDYPGTSDDVTIDSHTVTLTATHSVNDITISTGGTLAGGAQTLNVSGNWDSSTGTFNAGTSTVTLNGTADQTVTTNAQIFNALTLNNTGASGSDDIIISGALDINGTLTITDGDLDIGTNDPTVNTAGSVSIASNGSIDVTSRTANWTFDGTSTLTDSTSAIQDLEDVVVNGTSVTLASATHTDTLTITSGTLNAVTYGMTIDGNVDIDATFTMGSGLIKVGGNWDATGGTFSSTGDVMFTSTDTDETITTNGNSFNNVLINDGLVGYWKFDETAGTTAVDSSGYGNDGTHTGGPTISTTVPTVNYQNDRSVSFDGEDDYINVGSSDNLDITGAITIATWVNPNVGSGQQGILGTGDVRNAYSLYLRHSAGADIGFWVNPDDTVRKAFTGTVTYGQWNHIAGVWNGTILEVYLNGSLINNTHNTQTSTRNFQGVNVGFISNLASPRFFDGNIDEVRIYNRALTAGEVAALAAGNQPATATGTYTMQDAMDVDGDLSLNAGTLDTKSGSNYAITLAGDWNNYGGVFTSNTNTVTFDGTSGTISLAPGGTDASHDFYNIIFNDGGGTATWELQGALDVDNDFTVTDGIVDTKSGSNYAITVANDFAQNGGQVEARSATITVAGNFTADGTADSTDYNSASLVLTGTGNLTYNNLTSPWSNGFNNLTVGQSGNTTTLLISSIAVQNVLTIGSGVFTGSFDVLPRGNTPLSFDVNSTVSINKLRFFGTTQTIPLLTNGYDCSIGVAGTSTTVTQTGNVVINGSNSFTIQGDTFAASISTYNTAGYDLTVGGNIQVGAGNDTALKTFNATNSTVIVGGDFDVKAMGTGSVQAVATMTGSTVTLNGSALQTVTMSGSDFNNLTVTNASAAGIVFADAFTMANLTNITAGSKMTFNAADKYTISGTLSLTGSNGSEITILSDSGGTRFEMDVTGGDQDVHYINLTDSEASSNNITARNSTNNGGNDNAEAAPHWVIYATGSILKGTIIIVE